MINLNNLNRQHVTIRDELSFLEAEIKKGYPNMNIAETAVHISKLAGQLRIHLLEEDRFLYPNLIDGSDKDIQVLANQYQKEMGDLAQRYIVFKNQYNLVSKINDRKESFLSDAKIILEVLKNRIMKEDNELYALIKTRGL
ncbi:MAG: hypothetical protein K0S76_1705 [Herbinix sp.]|jgi:hemerythrin-like domain-containing protein|nr:hypothetical protein [Herbinix sp.]